VGEQVAAAPQQVGELGVADVGRAVDALAGRAVALGREDAGPLPLAQGRRADAEAVGDGADRQQPGRRGRVRRRGQLLGEDAGGGRGRRR
jgi:hypothetical protein